MADAVIRRAAPVDAGPILALLTEAGLPTAGVVDHLGDFLVAEVEGRLTGVAGIERYGDAALLRSVAVDAAARGTGLGGRLTGRALEAARRSGARAVYLLTTTAEGYFPRHGFRRTDRSSVPAAVRGSVEFTTACPSTAAVMKLDLGTEEATYG